MLLFTCVMLMRSDSGVHNALLSHRTVPKPLMQSHTHMHTHTLEYTQTYIKILHTHMQTHIIPPHISELGPASSENNHPWL